MKNEITDESIAIDAYDYGVAIATADWDAIDKIVSLKFYEINKEPEFYKGLAAGHLLNLLNGKTDD